MIREYPFRLRALNQESDNDHFKPQQNMHAIAGELPNCRLRQGSCVDTGGRAKAGNRLADDTEATVPLRHCSCRYRQTQIADSCGKTNHQENDQQNRWQVRHSLPVGHGSKATQAGEPLGQANGLVASIRMKPESQRISQGLLTPVSSKCGG